MKRIEHLFVSSLSIDELRNRVLSVDSSATLLGDGDNISNVMYANLETVSKKQLIIAIKNSTETIYIDDSSGNENVELLSMLSILSNYPNILIENIPSKYTSIYDESPNTIQRITTKPQLWVCGCSISVGEGVPRTHSYGELLSNEFDMDCTNLAKKGSSNKYQSSAILRADIQKGDIVCWGLTSINRTPLYGLIVDMDNNVSQDNNMFHVAPWTYEDEGTKDIVNRYIPLDMIYSEHMIYESIVGVQTVSNYCNKIGATLVLQGLLVDSDISVYFEVFPRFKQMYYGSFDDVGYDGYHPGIKTHQLYASTFVDLYNGIK